MAVTPPSWPARCASSAGATGPDHHAASAIVSARKTSSSLPDGCSFRQRRGRRIRDNPAAGDDDRAGAHRIDLLQDMRRDHDRLLRRHLLDQAAHLVLLVRVQPVGRLVQHQHRRIVQQRLRQADPALEAFRQCLHRLQPHALQRRQAERVIDPVGQFRPGKPRTRAQKRRKPINRHLRIGRRAFRQEPQHVPRGDAVVLHVVALDARGPGGRDHEPGQHPHGGRFPGAVRAEESQHLAAPHRERHVVHRREGAEAFGQSLDFDQSRLVRCVRDASRHLAFPLSFSRRCRRTYKNCEFNATGTGLVTGD